VHLIGFIIRIYHDSRSSERQNLLYVSAHHQGVLSVANVAPTYFAMEHCEGAVIAVPVHPHAYHGGS
jgi:hypothetical protein